MTALLRWLADLLTFGLVRRLDEEQVIQAENLTRMRAGKARIGTGASRDWAESLYPPFWKDGAS